MKYVLVVVSLLILSSCVVSKKKFDAEASLRESFEAKNYGLERDLGRLNDTVSNLKTEILTRDNRIEDLTAQMERLGTEKNRIQVRNNNLQDQNAILQNENDRLQRERDHIIGQSLTQQEKLDAALSSKLKELEQKEKVIDELQATLKQRDEAMQGILGKIENAIKQYNSSDLSVEMKNGKVYIAMSDKLLFKSGSATVDKTGKEALGTLANVLIVHPDMNIVVEGHTDNIPMRSGTFQDNWDLSVIRSTSVVRILTENYKLNANQITAAGKGEFAPKAENESPQGRALNRRIEIIIEPKLDEIYRVIKSKSP